MAARSQIAGVLAAATVGLTAIVPLSAAAQADELRVLVYSRTTGFRHVSIEDGIAAMQGLGETHDFEVVATEDPSVFTDAGLADFDVVIFLNTTGDPVPEIGQAPFERWFAAGGGWVGIHSAADSEYDWPFYGQLLGGAFFHSHPPQQQGRLVNEAPEHPATAHFDGQFVLFDEWYSFQRNPREDVEVLLSIDESTYAQDPNTTCLSEIQNGNPEFPCESGVMGDHPMSWCVRIDGGTGFYTALGHENYLYRLPDYLDHVWGGIQTAAGLVEADCGEVIASGAADPQPAPTPTSDPGDVSSPAPEPSAEPSPAPSPAAEELPATGASAPFATVGLAAMLAAAGLHRSRRRHT